MKKLELNQMENLEGGGIDCGEAVGFNIGLALGLGLIAVSTGGVGLALLSIGLMGGGTVTIGSYYCAR